MQTMFEVYLYFAKSANSISYQKSDLKEGWVDFNFTST